MRLIRTLLQHRWKAFIRSPALDQRLAAAFILGAIVLLISISLFALGQSLDEVFAQLFPGRNPILMVNGAMLYYLLFDLIGRYFVQGMPTASVEPYRHLPIHRAALVRFILAQVPLTLFNALPWLVAGPFVASFVYPLFGLGAALGWMVTFAALLLINSYLIFLARQQAAVCPVWVLTALSSAVGLVVLDRFGMIPLSRLSAVAFGAVVADPVWVLVPVLLAGALVASVYRGVHRGFYAEDMPAAPAASGLRQIDSTQLRKRYGVEGWLMANELKLIVRHRRPRSVLLSSLLLIIAYALLFYTDDPELHLGNSVLIVPGIAITGSVMLTYGQLLLAWEGGHFDGLLSANVSPRTYLKSKHRLLSISCLVSYLLTLPLALLGWPVLLVNTACFLFNGGVSSWLIIRFATSNRERVDLASGSLFNHQGITTAQLLLSVFTLLIPLVVGALGNAVLPGAGVALVGLLGLLGWLFPESWLSWITLHFQRKKYALATGFRQKTD